MVFSFSVSRLEFYLGGKKHGTHHNILKTISVCTRSPFVAYPEDSMENTKKH